MKTPVAIRFFRFSKSTAAIRIFRFSGPVVGASLALSLAIAPAHAAGGARKPANAPAPAASASPTPVAAPGTSGAILVSKPGVKGKTAKTLVFDPLKIEGRVARPRSIFTLERSKGAAFGQLAPEEDFTPKILDSVEGDPF
ncbi:MAG TPA: hypothetical protein VMV18_08190 [bacterium]|nr:hypothetical protein [bacterium]